MLPRKNGVDPVPIELEPFEVKDISVRTIDAVEDNEDKGEERATWGSQFDFLLSTIGFAVDLSNVFRFPYLCYRNGGGAFLLPYFIILIVGTLPMFLLELTMGQYNRTGCISLWKIVPLFKGVGWATCLITFYVAIYYNAVIAWSFYYLFASFSSVLPWTLCGQSWNTPNCWTISQNTTNSSFAYDSNITRSNGSIGTTIDPKLLRTSSAAEYFEYEVLKIQYSDGFGNIGASNWQLTLCLVLVFVCLYFILFKGVKSLGKAAWVFTTLPYIVLGILLVQGVMLDGATDGIVYFIKPDFAALSNPTVWVDAAIQIFYSSGVGFGVHVAYSSYNNFKNNVFRDCLIASAANSFTSLFSGFVVFAYLGYMAKQKSLPLDAVVNDSPGLVFMVYPEALATLPIPQFWSVLFFIMLISLGLDSLFGNVEGIMTAVRDEHCCQFKKLGKYDREFSTFLFVVIIFLCALPNVCYGGIYAMHFMDNYAASVSLLVVLLFQSVGVSWLYGTKTVCSNYEEMLGKKPSLYWIILWKFITPAVLIVVIIARFITLAPLTLDLVAGVYHYPSWSMIVAGLIIGSGVILIPIYFVVQFIKYKTRSLRTHVALLISPKSEHAKIRETSDASRLHLRHWISIR